MDIQQAEENVVTLLAIIPKSFAIYGTALGLVREGGVIEHDLDTDIGIFSEDFSWDLINRAVKHGFDIISVYGMRHHGLEVSLKREGIKTDIMLFYKDGDKVWNCLWDNGSRNNMADQIKHEYPAGVFKTKSRRIENGIALATLGEEYLKVVYGEDWKIPVKNWDWRTDHKCRV